MLSFLLAVHFVLTIIIIGLILLQKHDSDGALGAGGGGAAGGMFSVRGQANVLTKSTAILMGIFVLNCLVMAKKAKRVHHQESVIDRVANESVPLKNDTVKTESEENPTVPPAPEQAPQPSADKEIPETTPKK